MIRNFLRWLVFAYFILGASGCEKSATEIEQDIRLSDQELAQSYVAKQDDVYYFGFDLRSSPQEDARQYLPFLNYLTNTTGYPFKLRFTNSGKELIEALGNGKVHFAAIGAVGFIHAQHQYGALILARGLNAYNKSEYRSYIVVAPDSPIKEVKDLKGQRFAFGSTTSTQGHLIPTIVLQQHGITLDDLGSYFYTGSHQNCAGAVVAKRAAACGMQDTLAEQLAAQNFIRILYKSEYYPSSGIAANREVSAEVVKAVTTSLLNFDPTGKDAVGLYAWEKTEMPLGFVQAKPSDYAELEKYMQMFGLFDKSSK